MTEIEMINVPAEANQGIPAVGNVVTRVKLKSGNEEKNRITLNIAEPQQRVLNLIEKKPIIFESGSTQNDDDNNPSSKYVSKWNLLKSAGIPVPAFVIPEDENTVLMPDLTDDGSVIYGKTDFEALEFIDIYGAPDRSNKTLSDLVLATAQMDEIEKNALEIAGKATNANILLPFDDPLILICSPNGSLGLMVLDFGDTRNGAMVDADLPPTLREQNELFVTRFLHQLESLKRYISENTVVVDGERVELDKFQISWIDIVRAEANTVRLDDITEPVASGLTKEFPFYIVRNLRTEIELLQEQNLSGRQIYRRLAFRYHPDLYAREDEAVKELAENYHKALEEFRNSGLLTD